MPMNAVYRGPADLPGTIPVFPLSGALLLPRGQMPLNIFEPRYLDMVDDALRDGHRLIGMIQPDPAHPGLPDRPNLYKIGCAGRITQIAETGDGRYLMQLTGVARFRIMQELPVTTAYRQCIVDFTAFTDDFTARKGEEEVDRKAVLSALTQYLKANNLKADWVSPHRPQAPGNPRLPAHQGSPGIRLREAGADFTLRQARLSDPRRHSDHAAGRSASAGVVSGP
jgi:Lon protease-like protein